MRREESRWALDQRPRNRLKYRTSLYVYTPEKHERRRNVLVGVGFVCFIQSQTELSMETLVINYLTKIFFSDTSFTENGATRDCDGEWACRACLLSVFSHPYSWLPHETCKGIEDSCLCFEFGLTY
jgi:hypothetical protein